MIRSQPLKLTNSKGELITLTRQEQHLANLLQNQINEKFCNSLGYEINITSLTTIMKKITEQKFFEIPFADYLPVRVGDGAWSSNLTTYRSFTQAAAFEEGILNTGANNTRLGVADAGVDSLTIQVFNWAKNISWSIFDLELAAKSGNWDLVTAKEKARKKNWDLGIQKVAFLGTNNSTNSQCLGLLNQQGVTNNKTLITAPISTLTPSQLKTFVAQVIEVYRTNCQRTCWPTHFIIPESDYNGLASQASADFPMISVKKLLEEAFQLITGKANFKILPLSYADGPYGQFSALPANQQLQVYTLLNYDEESLRMDLPVDYTNTLANSIDNFVFQNVGYGQFTGVLTYRPLEMLYFTFPTPVPFV